MTDPGSEWPLSPDEVPVFRDADARDAAYRRAERESAPFVGVDEEAEGYTLTYDLLPAGARLSEATHERLREAVTEELEAILDDPDRPTEEVNAGVGEQMGNVYFLAEEGSAREVAAAITATIADGEWVADGGPGV